MRRAGLLEERGIEVVGFVLGCPTGGRDNHNGRVFASSQFEELFDQFGTECSSADDHQIALGWANGGGGE